MSGFNRRAGVTKLKQRTKEWFNKNKKTVDSEFDCKKQMIDRQMSDTRHLFKEVLTIFTCNEATMVQNEQLGACFKEIYADSKAYAEYAQKLAADLAANKKIINRNQKIRANLEQHVADCESVYALYSK